MVFVERDGQGNIISIHARPQQSGADERLAKDDPEVVAFRNRKIPNPLADEARSVASVPDLRDVVLKMLGESP